MLFITNKILSKFNNIFGEPNTGLHRFRLGNIAIIDYILSLIVAFILSYVYTIPFDLTTISVLTVAILIHLIFNVNTSSINYLKNLIN